MIPKECKRLAEVDFPIAEVSRHAAREKESTNRGHPATLHQWWARRPLASSRAMLMALLLPDPCDAHCPDAFKKEARKILLGMHKRPQGWSSTIKTDHGLRRIILKFISDFSSWDQSANPDYLEPGCALVKAAYGEEIPVVIDPFAGGGSIPLEASRLGCDVFASDLNPVACMILKIILEDIPRYGLELAENLHKIGGEMKRQVKKTFLDFHPSDSDGAVPIAYLWARTVHCESPNCGAEIPLVRSFWLCKKKKTKRMLALWPHVVQSNDRFPRIEFEIFKPQKNREVYAGTIMKGRATCICCGAVLLNDRVRSQLAAQRGGSDVIFNEYAQRIGGARMIAVVTSKPGQRGRYYRLPTDADYKAVYRAQKHLSEILDEWNHRGKQGLCPVPDEPLPAIGTLGFRIQRYGMLEWGDLFTARQKVILIELGKLIRKQETSDNDVIRRVIAFCVDKIAMQNSSSCRWKASGESLMDMFSRQALPMVWDFAESSPISGSTGDFYLQIDRLVKIISKHPIKNFGVSQLADATQHPLPDQSVSVWFTDPPYYDAIPYADLSDFFLVWLKRMLPDYELLCDPFDPDNPLSPKTREAVQDKTKEDNGRSKNSTWFEETMACAFAEGHRILNQDGIASVVFAHKTTDGWEALLSGMIRGGWIITGSWPIVTEMGTRMRARNSAALATSVHLVCRPRLEHAPVGDWANVIQELPIRVGEWMARLQDEGIRGADMVFACIGPALEIFSKYSHVEMANGHRVGLSEYLKKIWEVVGRIALEQILGTAEAQTQNNLANTLEEDSRLTALFLWALQSPVISERNREQIEIEEVESTNTIADRGFKLPFDVVRSFAQPMGINLDSWIGRIIHQENGIVYLLPASSRVDILFGENGTSAVVDWVKNDSNTGVQLTIFPELMVASDSKSYRRGNRITLDNDIGLQMLDATVLDRVHVAMLLQSGGHANMLRAMIDAEIARGTEFLGLANALSALYPTGSKDKRLLDAMLLAAPK